MFNKQQLTFLHFYLNRCSAYDADDSVSSPCPPDSSFFSGASCDSPSSPSPPLAVPPLATSPGLLTCGGRAFASCLPPPPPPPPPSSFPLSPLSSLSSLSPPSSETQRLYISPPSPFYWRWDTIDVDVEVLPSLPSNQSLTVTFMCGIHFYSRFLKGGTKRIHFTSCG